MLYGEALKEAQKAYDQAEVSGRLSYWTVKSSVVAITYAKEQGATLHAEIKVIRKQASTLGGDSNYELFVTLEPCPMCSGLMILARLKRLRWRFDPKAGTTRHLYEPPSKTKAVSTTSSQEVEQGILEDECKEILQTFFKASTRTQ